MEPVSLIIALAIGAGLGAIALRVTIGVREAMEAERGKRRDLSAKVSELDWRVHNLMKDRNEDTSNQVTVQALNDGFTRRYNAVEARLDAMEARIDDLQARVVTQGEANVEAYKGWAKRMEALEAKVIHSVTAPL